MPQIQTRKYGPARLIRGDFKDFEDFEGMVSSWDLDFRQLDRGTSPVECVQVIDEQTQIIRFRFGRQYEQRGNAPKGMINIGIPDPTKPLLWRQREIPPPSLISFAPGYEYLAVSPKDFTGTTISYDAGLLFKIADDLGMPEALEGTDELGLRIGVDAASLNRVMVAVENTLSLVGGKQPQPPTSILNRYLSEVIPELLVAALASVSGQKERIPPTNNRGMIRKRAVAFIDSHAHEAPSILTICRASGTSMRTLEYAFKEHYGVTPKAYLHATRLMKVRRELIRLERDVPIADIAGRWGFWHMGQFAADYRRMFGELPSATSSGRHSYILLVTDP